jgi:hypothetical protein
MFKFIKALMDLNANLIELNRSLKRLFGLLQVWEEEGFPAERTDPKEDPNA